MSDQKIDHKAEAARVVDTVLPDGEATYANAMAYAQVHATLALVEQQRIANLIARLGVLTHLNPGEQLNAEGVELVNRLSAQLAEVGLS